MAHYLVTGGAGFIGSHLSEELVRRGHRVRVADSLITGKRSNLDHIRGIEFLEGDLADLDFAHTAVQGCDYVLHQAAIPSVPRSVKDPLTSNRANVDGTLNVLLAVARRRRQAPGLRRLLVRLRRHADAAEARGDADQSAVALRAAEGDRRAVPADVHPALRPRDGRHPLLQRLRPAAGSDVAVFRRDLGVRDRAAREPSADHLRRRRADPRLHLRRQRRRRRAARLRGAGRQRRGHQRRHRRPHFAESVVRGDAQAGRRRRHAGLRRVARRGDVRDSQADITKARELLGYEPIVSFEEGLRKTVDWYRSAETAAAR